MSQPLLSVKGVWREYIAGDQAIAALRGVDLTINAGEFVAIIGQSGSGKSTLMNILGCLDRPTRGTYEVSGRDTSTLSPDELSGLRREHFGFIFQRYHLLSDLDARGNVEVPAIYAGWSASKRKTRAEALLNRLGLSERLHNRPNQLSGGQQQRVSVARALMNGGEIILADEPTGALDSRSGEEMLRILDELSAEGHTIILVTHDSKVAAHAHRIIEIKDGEVIDDRLTENANKERKVRELSSLDIKESWTAWLDRLGDAFRMALLAMNAHKLRTFLTMLGIIIGIASVVAIFALGNGSRKAILDEIAASGSNTITVKPGAFAGDQRASAIKTLVLDDVEALEGQPYAEAITPTAGANVLLRYGNKSANANLQGVGDQFFRVKNVKIARGRQFTSDEVKAYGQGAVIGDDTAKEMFPKEEPLGKTIFLGAVPLTVIGIAAPVQGTLFDNASGLLVMAPYTTVMNRIVHQQDVTSIIVRMNDNSSAALVEDAINKILLVGHDGRQDYHFISSEAVRIAKERAALIQNLLIGAVGAISLLVGGIGVMNIMLVSVSERTREIGVRSAIGARRSDIMSQFIIEAVMVCLIGGALGVGLALMVGFIFSKLNVPFTMLFTSGSIIGAFLTASLIGLVFGWLPARNAAMLDPVDALARD